MSPQSSQSGQSGLKAQRICVALAARRVLHDIDFEVRPGEIVGIVGPADAGKTTLLKALAGLLPIADGVTLSDGSARDLCHDAWRAQVGFAFQNDALFDGLTVYDNVAFALRRRRWSPERIDARVRERLADVDLLDAATRLPAALSGGMRKRVGIARATAIDANVGLFDDPIAGLDPQTGRRILAMLMRLTRDRGWATCIVANDLSLVLPCCDRVVMLHEGRVLYAGDVKNATQSKHPAVRQFFNGTLDGPL